MRKFFALLLLLVSVVTVTVGAVSSFYIVDDAGQKIPFGTGGELHFENISGLPNHVTIFPTAADISSHTGDTSIHFTESSIDHEHIQHIGFYHHTSLDNHVDDPDIHFPEAGIDHTAIQNVGTNSHAQIDTHLADSTTHFTESSIDHTALQNIGTNSHSAIDSHIADATTHFTESSIEHDNLNGASGFYNHSAINAHIDNTSIHGGGGPANIPTGTIWMFGGSTAPSGWLICDGSEISRSTYSALFAVTGETYGAGDGSTTFVACDFRGRAGIGAGQGSGLSNRSLGETMGEEEHVLIPSELPSSLVQKPLADRYTSQLGGGTNQYGGTTNNQDVYGQDLAHNTMQPSLVINYIIKY
jgi:microcystin-dependent protein